MRHAICRMIMFQKVTPKYDLKVKFEDANNITHELLKLLPERLL